MMNKTEFIEKYTIDEQGFYIHGVNPDDIEEDLTAFEQSIREDCAKENRILIMWLKNLTHKIMKFDDFKGLRGYPITHFIEKYQSNKN